ncbi:MAG TPA: ABC transporter ATP-binding protein [Pseudomonadales bacterium]
MDTLLAVERLHSLIGGQKILDGISFAMQRGQLCSLLGPSGCGKTTLLRTLAGFQPIERGRITLDKHDITHCDAAKRGIGFIFQDYALFPHLTVAENIAYGIHKQPDRQARVDELLQLIELAALARRYPHELSGGQQQRVAIARALAPRPRLLLMDEPFSNLDTELRKSLNLGIRKLLKDAGLTAILVTHDQTEAFAFGDQVGILNGGRLEQWGSPYTLYHQPASRFVAEFIGQGQLIRARRLDNSTLETAFGVIACPKPLPAGADDVQLLTRPDDWLIDDQGYPVTIRDKQFAGTQTFYTVINSDGQHIRIAAPSHQDHPVDGQLFIRPQFEHIITF